ncbi:MAG TPA: YncE family protein [bacterium]|nr:YncE family protein [bacterium]
MVRTQMVFWVTLVLIVAGVSSSAGAPTAYVVNLADGVSVIDTGTNTIVTTVTAGTGPQAVAITPDGRFAYVVNLTSNDVSVINTATNTVASTVAVGFGPFGVAITPNGAFAYVTAFGARCANGGVWVISTATNAVVATVPLAGCSTGVAITPDGAFAYVANNSSSTVSVIETVTNHLVLTVPVGTSPQGIAITPDGAFVYVTQSALSGASANSVSVIETATNSVVATISVGAVPEGVVVTPNGAFAYVTNTNANNVSVIETTTNAVVATLDVGVGPVGIAVTPDGAFVYVTNSNSDSVSVIDTALRTVVATVPVEAGAGPRGIAIANPDTTPPETSIVSGPAEGSLTNSPQAVFTFSGTDDRTQATALGFNCSLDGAAFGACVNPQTYTGLASGQHAFMVRAVDAAGNVDPTPATRTWTVDTTPPDTSLLSGPVEGSVTASVQAAFTFAGTDDQTVSSSLTFICILDEVTSAVCASPQTYEGLTEGRHTFTVAAIDAAGNTDSTPATRTWTVDTTPPALSVAATPSALWPPNHQLIEVTVAVSATDNVGVASVVLSKVECNELGQGACPADAIQGADIGTLDTSILLRSERTGGSDRTYTLTYLATDLAGNTVTATATVVVARSP